MARKNIETGTVRVFEDADDRGHWFGLEQWNGSGWTNLRPEHPTFWTRDAAENYVSLKFPVAA
jgi:hypothetical protein